MTIHTVVSVHCDACAGALGGHRGEVSPDWDDLTHYFDNARDALLAARSAWWHVDARKILCPACWALEIQAISQEEE